MESTIIDLDYIKTQQQHYALFSMVAGRKPAALDALWRAASHANLLLDGETSHHKLTPDRVERLLSMLGWTEKPAPTTCHYCQGTGRDPMSDTVNWFPCNPCHGKGFL